VKSNYDSSLEITNDGRRIMARGPLLWDTPGEERVKIIVTITQDSAVATGASGEFKRGEDGSWDYQADTPSSDAPRFHDGVATAVGVLQVTRPDPVHLLPPWTQVVVLETEH
jgi:hypothetical protein